MNPVPLFWQYVVHVIESVSSLPFVEQVKFIGHFHDLSNNKSVSADELRAKGYSDQAIEVFKKKERDSFPGLESLGIKFSKPLNSFRSDILSLAFTLYDGYEKGILPFSGSLAEQPSQIMEIFGLIQALRHEQEQKNFKKLQNEAKKAQAKNKRFK